LRRPPSPTGCSASFRRWRPNRIRTLKLRGRHEALLPSETGGDIQAIREIWFMPTYLPPFRADRLDVVVDVGANIGFTNRVLRPSPRAPRTCVAIEPDADNARVLRRNLEQNGIRGDRARGCGRALGRKRRASLAPRSRRSGRPGRRRRSGAHALDAKRCSPRPGDRRVDLLKDRHRRRRGRAVRGRHRLARRWWTHS